MSCSSADSNGADVFVAGKELRAPLSRESGAFSGAFSSPCSHFVSRAPPSTTSSARFGHAAATLRTSATSMPVRSTCSAASDGRAAANADMPRVVSRNAPSHRCEPSKTSRRAGAGRRGVDGVAAAAASAATSTSSSTSSSPSPTRSAAARPASASSLNTTALRTSTSKHVRSSTRRHCLLTKRRRPRFAAPRASSKTFSTRPSASASLSFDLRRAASGAGTRNRPPTLQRACAPSLFVSPSRTKRRTRANASSGRKTAPRVSFRRIRSSLPGMTTPRPDAGAVDAPAGTSTWLARAIAAPPARVAASLMTPSRGNEVRARERPGGGGHRRSDADEEDCCAFSMRRPENATTSGAP